MAAPRRAPDPRPGGRPRSAGSTSGRKPKTDRRVVVGVAVVGALAVLVLWRTMAGGSSGGPTYGTSDTGGLAPDWLGTTTATSASGGGATTPPVIRQPGPKPKRKPGTTPVRITLPLVRTPGPPQHMTTPHPTLHTNRLI